MNTPKIKTTQTIYPQIYAYMLPTVADKSGWVKIGYTERQDVDKRILEQTKTAAINLPYNKLWSAPARFAGSNDWFKDHDFHLYLRNFKNIEQQPQSEWFYYNGTPEQSFTDFSDFTRRELNQAQAQIDYTLRSEQSAAIEQTLAYFRENPEGEFLWNAKPRFGKTLTTYDLVRKMGATKVLILTNRPAIAHSWFDDFYKFIAWQSDFAFVSTSETLKNRPVLTRDQFLAQHGKPGGKQNMVAFISLQDLKGSLYFGGTHNKLKWVKELEWDLLVIDEAHEGADTIKAETAFDQIQRNFTLHLSGTPFKAIATGKFGQDEIYNWSYADEQSAKQNWNEQNGNNPYETLPQLNLFSYQISPMLTDEINQGAQIDGENHDYAFDLNEFFGTDERGRLNYQKDVEKWLDTLSRNEKYPFSTPELRAELKHTFWLLNRVDSARALQKLLKKHPVFEHYEIILAAGDGSDPDTPAANQNALDRVRKAIKEHERTITLSVGQLTTGITIPEWTAVLMLSNMQSPAQYMQAAFRAQNPWTYEDADGQRRQKQNAYVFDFAPERTLIIYDEFANNLLSQTSGGRGTGGERESNIKKLLNFFPVIAEDNEGRMVELDVNQVLTIPKTFKAREVVRRGFMSNLLFQNISGIFASTEAREILQQLAPVQEGKNVPAPKAPPIDTRNIETDEDGNALVAKEIVIAQTAAHFGEKIYGDVGTTVQNAIQNSGGKPLAQTIADTVKAQTQNSLKNLAAEQGVSEKFAERTAAQAAQAVAREVEKVEKQTDIKRAEAQIDYQKAVVENSGNSAKLAEIQAAYESKQQQIEQEKQQQIQDTVNTAMHNQAEAATQAVLQKAEDDKKTEVEDDIRARLRGFTRTIPAFLMAYGRADTTLENFDAHIDDAVFQEVTGITLTQFRALRDEYKFFDVAVFNESVQEFSAKRTALANYFDESQAEDIFDYIPPQKTNQIFTPRRVVQLMLDALEAENPDIFQNPHARIADLYMKSGLYLTETVKRLFAGLAAHIPDEKARLKHILEKQIYGFAPSAIIHNIARNFIFGFDPQAADIDQNHIVCLDTTPYAMGNADFDAKLQELFGENVKFDAIVGNPPYQESAKGESTKDTPIYHYFYNLAEKFATRYCLISPARFLFKAGSTDKEWNQKMLNDEHLKVVFYEQDSANVFPTTDIKGGGSSYLSRCQ